MTIEIKVPSFPESVKDGRVVSWHKRPGDAVRRDEVVVDVETDKVLFEVPSPASGHLKDILVEEGATVVSGQVLGELEEGELARPETTEAPVEAEAEAATGTTPGQDDEATRENEDTSPVLTPSARRLITEQGLDAGRIEGTGRGGRILKEDVVRYLDERAASPADDEAGDETSPAPATAVYPFPSGGNRPERREPMSRLRTRIAERLVEAQQTAAILTTFNEIDMAPVIALRKRYRQAFTDRHGVKLGFMPFFVHAVSEALHQYPEVNASIDGEDIVYHDYVDIGIAVGSKRGLVVPILRDADGLSMADIERQIADFAARADEGHLSIEEMTGGTFTITNGGVFGSLLSTPIINPPQSAILGMHKIEERPVVIDGEIVIRPMMYVALSYDHRLIDGRGAVQFLVRIKQLLEDPTRMLLDV